ncbi:MAG: hydroxysqualene dehydroxylase HpnE [Pseudomonadota bacterium]|nr:hydroxysqualene dehydroxylase HpnE [Pseudomonadota bacterium]
MKLAVVGAGWAGLAATVRATEAGHDVSLYEMAGQTGGRARAVEARGLVLDNGQHILIGAYHRTLALMRHVGVDVDQALHRQPLVLRYPDGQGLQLPEGPAWLAFTRAVAGCVGWRLADKLSLLTTTARWGLAGFECDAALTVDALCAPLTPAVRTMLIDPLCIAALNTPAHEASAQVLLRVLRDALFGGPGAADLLLPRQSLSALLPSAAEDWLRHAGAQLHLATRVQRVDRSGTQWQLANENFDAVVIACSAAEAARLCEAHAPAFAARAAALRYEPIVTVYLHCPGARLPTPMVALRDGPSAPAQFAFDHGALGAEPGRFAFVVSGAREWVDRGLDATAEAVLRQAQSVFGPEVWPGPPTLLRVLADKRATFRCTPNLDRPTALIAPGLIAAGDYVAGPYPATLEGAVRSGEAAAAAICRSPN